MRATAVAECAQRIDVEIRSRLQHGQDWTVQTIEDIILEHVATEREAWQLVARACEMCITGDHELKPKGLLRLAKGLPASTGAVS
jgi:hypothetical protein